jgi:hypothetical protein
MERLEVSGAVRPQFVTCIIHILHAGCAKIKKKIRRQKVKFYLRPVNS